jgi:16S rRNA (adenine1518-N6/adenine1519-N6)-dimethyltransferase
MTAPSNGMAFGCNSVHRIAIPSLRRGLVRTCSSTAPANVVWSPPVPTMARRPPRPEHNGPGYHGEIRGNEIGSESRSAPLHNVDERRREGLRPKQSLGQNFLKDASMAARICDTFAQSVDAICPGVGIVEVGPGTGAITSLLLEKYPDMVGLEIDQRAVAYLGESLPALSVQHIDVLAVDWGALASKFGGSVAVIGNLPYNIVSQIMFALLEAPSPSVRLALVMMQKEVAERVTAIPRTKQYGILSVVAQLYAKPKIMFSVPSTVFVPRPSVESAMVQFEFAPHTDLNVYNTTLTAGLRLIVRNAFQQRRKVMRNSLRNLCEEHNVELPDKWALKRPEELPPAEFIELTKFVFAENLASPDLRDAASAYPDTVWRHTRVNGTC